jgi:hypothetical protein
MRDLNVSQAFSVPSPSSCRIRRSSADTSITSRARSQSQVPACASACEISSRSSRIRSSRVRRRCQESRISMKAAIRTSSSDSTGQTHPCAQAARSADDAAPAAVMVRPAAPARTSGLGRTSLNCPPSHSSIARFHSRTAPPAKTTESGEANAATLAGTAVNASWQNVHGPSTVSFGRSFGRPFGASTVETRRIHRQGELPRPLITHQTWVDQGHGLPYVTDQNGHPGNSSPVADHGVSCAVHPPQPRSHA